jgi:putative AdoMet-dependent methyltransferase
MTIQFPASEFDEWAKKYDSSILNNESFPFLGYKDLLAKIVVLAQPRIGLKVLDLGCGTGNLSLPLAQEGCEVWGTDFSKNMLAEARRKSSAVHWVEYDIRLPLTPELTRVYDCIVSTYTFHHFPLDEKIKIVKQLKTFLSDAGSIFIGDIAFTEPHFKDYWKARLSDEWEEEYYWVAAVDLPAFAAQGINIVFMQVTPYSGILHIRC